MSSRPHNKNAGALMTTVISEDDTNTMSRRDKPDVNMADSQAAKLSPNSTKSRSLPSTPSQRPQSPPARHPSPVTSRPTREGSPQSLHGGSSRTPPAYRRGIICKYETGMKQARRRVPYTLGPDKLDRDPEAAAKKLNPKEEFRLTSDMDTLYRILLPTNESEDRRHSLVRKLQTLLAQRWPGQNIKVSVFGSTGNKLGTNDSDVDICITTNCKEVEHVCSIADLLAKNGMERVVCVSSAKVPIVKVWDPDLQVACDMNVNNPIALENTELIRSYVSIDDRFRPLAMIVKYWAKRRILNDAALGGTLSSYTWICLVLNFLQTRKPPVLPSLQQGSNLQPHLVGGVNVAFDKRLDKYEGYGKANTSSLGSLLFQFFHYYGHELDFEKNVLSVRLGAVIPKSQKAWQLLQDNRLCVEEPFNIGRNLGNTADDTSVRGIHLELRRACELLAAGDLEQCCEQFVPPQPELAPRRADTFVAPTTKAIIPQPPPQPQHQHQHPRSGRNSHKNGRRAERQGNAGRRASNPPTRPLTHLRDLPFQMTPQELQLQAQHQQHLLHDQLFQQYQYLQMQEQELRLQLYRHKGLVAASSHSSSGGYPGSDSADDMQDSPLLSRAGMGARVPLTAPLFQSRFSSAGPVMSNGASSGIVTNPASPLLGTVLPDSRRYARRASVNNATASTLRAQSQPARGIPAPSTLPYLSQRFDVPVRQVDSTGTRRSSTTSNSNDMLAGYLPNRFTSQGTRYDAGRRPVEYVGYYVGQSPSLSAYPRSATISPIPSSAGLAIHNGGLSPRMSTRSSRIPSVSTSPASHYASLANGPTVMTPVTENVPASTANLGEFTPPSARAGPLIVDGSVNSPPRRQIITRPIRSSSDELDISVTTSEDVALDTPSSSDEMSNNGSMRRSLANGANVKHVNNDIIQERDFLSLNGTSTALAEPFGYDETESPDLLRKMEEERSIRQLTNALAAATISNGHAPGTALKTHVPVTSTTSTIETPLMPMANGSHVVTIPTASTPQEWQTQSKKKKKNKKAKSVAHEVVQASFGGEIPPQDEALRKGG